MSSKCAFHSVVMSSCCHAQVAAGDHFGSERQRTQVPMSSRRHLHPEVKLHEDRATCHVVQDIPGDIFPDAPVYIVVALLPFASPTRGHPPPTPKLWQPAHFTLSLILNRARRGQRLPRCQFISRTGVCLRLPSSIPSTVTYVFSLGCLTIIPTRAAACRGVLYASKHSHRGHRSLMSPSNRPCVIAASPACSVCRGDGSAVRQIRGRLCGKRICLGGRGAIS